MPQSSYFNHRDPGIVQHEQVRKYKKSYVVSCDAHINPSVHVAEPEKSLSFQVRHGLQRKFRPTKAIKGDTVSKIHKMLYIDKNDLINLMDIEMPFTFNMVSR